MTALGMKLKKSSLKSHCNIVANMLRMQTLIHPCRPFYTRTEILKKPLFYAVFLVFSPILWVLQKCLRKHTADSILEYISMVFQNVYLFHDSIENNIKFGKPDATHEEVEAAAKRSCCHDFISALPDGYNTIIGEGDSTLSGGEKQRISIARAMLKDAPIIILDEATSSVDPENEQALLSAIVELTKNKTLISIAHRLSTVQNADQIVVINQGRVVQRGTHQSLISQEGIYRNFLKQKLESAGWAL